MSNFITNSHTLEQLASFKLHTGLVLPKVKVGSLVEWSVNDKIFRVLKIDDFGIKVADLKTDKEMLVPVTVFVHSFSFVNDVYKINFWA